MTPLTLHPPAKINLALEVVGRRTDGYHELVSVMQTVGLHDDLTIDDSDDCVFQCSDPSLQTGNLVERAVEVLRLEAGTHHGCRLTLRKSIPAGAGLGGGSSDAALTLLGLVGYWRLPLSCHDLSRIAADLGSDVPFFLYGGTCLVEGRGERVTPVPYTPRTWYLLVNPGIHVSTADVFRALDPRDWSDGEATRDLARDLEMGKPPRLGRNALRNALFRICPEARTCYDDVTAVAPTGAGLSGSGPTVIAPFTSRDEAVAAELSLRGSGYWTVVAPGTAAWRGISPCV